MCLVPPLSFGGEMVTVDVPLMASVHWAIAIHSKGDTSTMNKKGLIAAVAGATGTSNADAGNAVDPPSTRLPVP